MTGLRITVLAENTASKQGLLAEHGLSFWIERGDDRVLFDTGQGRVLVGNAGRLGIRLKLVDAIVLSHGHYDHTGGLGDALGGTSGTKVYAHREAFAPKFVRDAGGTAREIGIPFLDEAQLRTQADLVWVEEQTEVCAGIRITGPVPRATAFEDVGGPFFRDRDCSRPDEILDDQAAFVETPQGTLVILGCAHAGVINTLWYVRMLTNGRPIHTVMGGMHLGGASAERLHQTVAELRRMKVQRLLPCHCTGMAATVRLWTEFPGTCSPAPSVRSWKSKASPRYSQQEVWQGRRDREAAQPRRRHLGR
jgi:7,8-dihydropterin-6-yl-methyl-4-(beta-D-ribofuranosyl)aminobenzene 5'-phosphate synthase